MQQRRRRYLLWLLIAVAILGGLTVAYLGGELFTGMDTRDDRIHFVYLGILLVFLLATVGVRWRHRPMTHARHAVIWASIALGLVIVYSFRFEIAGLATRVKGELLPGFGATTAPGVMEFRADRSGHFRVVAHVNGTPIRFLVDTGASLVVLSPQDAGRIGQDPARLFFGQTFETANGVGKGAAIRLDEVRIGDIAVRNVRASVNAAPMSDSLLGMSFLGRLGGYRVENGVLTLTR
jgi:aspartyl protease family protein